MTLEEIFVANVMSNRRSRRHDRLTRRRLILLDLYLMRWPVIGALIAGAVSSPSCRSARSRVRRWRLPHLRDRHPEHRPGDDLIVQEKKDKVQIFMLSLPVSTTQYMAAKVMANAIAFAGPWIALTVGIVAVIDVSALPNGMPALPGDRAGVTADVLLRPARHRAGVGSDRLARDGITVGNVSVNFLIPWLLSRPSVSEPHRPGRGLDRRHRRGSRRGDHRGGDRAGARPLRSFAPDGFRVRSTDVDNY